MNSVETRPPFFPNSRTSQAKINSPAQITLKRNSEDRIQELQHQTGDHAKVNIGDKIKDFSKIKRIADATSGQVDNSAKIADLKSRIQAGTYQVDYDALADKILESEY